MIEFWCWIPDWEDEDEGCACQHYFAETAAEDYCDKRLAESGGSWPRGGVIVHMRERGGVVTAYNVILEYEPSFHASALRHGPRQAYDWETGGRDD